MTNLQTELGALSVQDIIRIEMEPIVRITNVVTTGLDAFFEITYQDGAVFHFKSSNFGYMRFLNFENFRQIMLRSFLHITVICECDDESNDDRKYYTLMGEIIMQDVDVKAFLNEFINHEIVNHEGARFISRVSLPTSFDRFLPTAHHSSSQPWSGIVHYRFSGLAKLLVKHDERYYYLMECTNDKVTSIDAYQVANFAIDSFTKQS